MEARLLHVLHQIRTGANEFKPKDESPEEVGRFQPIAKAVVHAHQIGYIQDVIPLVDCHRGGKYYKAILTTGGLTYRGEEALADEIGHSNVIDDLVSEITHANQRKFLQDQWNRAIERSRSDPRGAVTAANSFLEAVMKWIVDQRGITPPENRKKLFELATRSVTIEFDSKISSEIVRCIDTMLREVSVLRSKVGDAHGARSTTLPPTPGEALLSINLAGTVAIYLLDRLEEQSSL